MMAGKSLNAWTIEAALKSNSPDVGGKSEDFADDIRDSNELRTVMKGELDKRDLHNRNLLK